MTEWHSAEPADVLNSLESSLEQGLDARVVRERLEEFGSNELEESGGRSPWEIIWEQISSAMVLLLFAAGGVSLFLGEYTDAAAVFAIIFLNGVLGFFQDYRAEKALAALKQLAVPTVRVRRGGKLAEIDARELVPGDVVIVESGQLVPADCRLLESSNLKIEEASLTGESEPVEKNIRSLEAVDTALGDRINMAYMGTLVTYGHGVGVVTGTGMSTELGKIARSLQTVDLEQTPLQRRLGQLGRSLAVVSLVIVAFVFGMGMLAGESPRLMLMTSLSLAVAIVPEGLPAVATVALALGARRMVRRKALIRKLPAVETLGSVTIICSDKTGTLTQNRMTVTKLVVFDGSGNLNTVAPDQAGDGEIESSCLLALSAAALCNDAELADESSDAAAGSELEAIGEPTEAAMVVAAARRGLLKSKLVASFHRVAEVPFDSDRKRMMTVHKRSSDSDESLASSAALAVIERARNSGAESGAVGLMKGASDSVVDICSTVFEHGQVRELSDSDRSAIAAANDNMASQGVRVLAVAFRTFPANIGDVGIGSESAMTFIGLMGLIDPPRPEVREAVTRCSSAGIRPVMITGDHPLTAVNIAQQLGITDRDAVMTGRDLAGKGPEELEPLIDDVDVFARVAPSDKLHIVQALQNKDEVVAMTGDGVNDAPALKQAHIGVAMGKVGTDVSKEASEMVLLDDNFATIVNAVEEGRIVYDNIRKFVKYTMTSNAGEVWVMVLGPLLGMPLPLLPLQILWVNLVTDGLPGLALAIEPAERSTMQRPPYPVDEHIMGRGMWRDIAWVGLLMGGISLIYGYLEWSDAETSEAHWRTIVFTVLTLSQMGNAMAIRSSRDSLFQIGLFSNRAMLGAVSLTFALQLGVIYAPWMQRIFKTTALSLSELGICLLLSTVVFAGIEIQKWFLRSRTPSES